MKERIIKYLFEKYNIKFSGGIYVIHGPVDIKEFVYIREYLDKRKPKDIRVE